MSTVVRQYSINDISNLYRIAYGDFETDAAGWDREKFSA